MDKVAKNILIRGVSPKIQTWIEEERLRRNMTKQEFITFVLDQAYESKQAESSKERHPVTRHPRKSIAFTFADVFAGIGGFRLGLEKLGGRCVFTCEWDKYAQKTYHAWFGETPYGDIRKLKTKDFPDCDILAAGFPCQPFSIAGVTKKNALGRAHGFDDVTQGTRFFHLASIIKAKRPELLSLRT